MDDMAATLARARQAAQPPEAPPTPAPPVAEPTPPPPVAEQPAPTTENETTITITVKNPQGLLEGSQNLFGEDDQDPASGDRQTVGVVGKKQRRNQVNGPLRYYGAMANARVLAMDRAIGWQIKKSMDVYLATHDNKYPKDLDEYMDVIVQQNMIDLPELEQGQEFFYDPEDHELKIVEWVDAPAEEQPAAEEPPPAQ